MADIHPQPKKIMQLHDDVVNRDKVLTGTLNIVSGFIANAGNRRTGVKRRLKRQKPMVYKMQTLILT